MSSLSNVVSSLVRAQMGSSVPTTVTDEELDRHVAELIVKEAKRKSEQYLKSGVRAYLPDPEPDGNVPKTNKRFLHAIIRNTDEHNKSVLKAQAEAAQEAKAEREEQLRMERRARAKEEAERSRQRQGGSSRRDSTWRSSDGRPDRSSGDRRYDRYERDGRPEEDRSSRHRKRRRSRSTSNERRRHESTRHGRRRHHDDSDAENAVGESSKSHRQREKKVRDRDDDSSRERSSLKAGNRSEHKRSSRDDRKSHKDGHKRRKHSLESVEDRDSVPKGQGDVRRSEDSGNPGSGRTTAEPRTLAVPASSKPGKLSGASTPRLDSVHDSLEITSDASGSSRVAQVRPKANDLSAQFRRREQTRASPPPPASPTLSEEEDIGYLLSKRRRAPAEPRSQDHPAGGSSKMDKYFEESYDPRLDVGPLTIPTVPTTGLIDGNEFERWEAMLDIIRQRREDKAERKRMERLGISKEKEKSKGTSEAWTMSEGVSIMDIKYSKRGATREWDMGKDGA